MFADYIKMATKTAAIIAVVATIIIAFNAIQIPVVDFTSLTDGLGKALAIGSHYIPYFQVIWNFTLTLIGFVITYYTLKLSFISFKFIFKIFE